MDVPPRLADRARALLAGEFTPLEPRPAATVVLLRDAAGGPEVYLLRRVRAMSFAPGAHVFPGGSVEPGDGAGDLDPFLVAAARETFEEAGVLLAGPTGTTVVDDVRWPTWEEARAALEAGSITFPALLAEHELVLRTDLLRPMARWVTPEPEVKRFDTYFFLAALPAGQIPQDVGTEADQRLWIRPADALAQNLAMLPPTIAMLHDVARFDSVAAALAAPREIVTVRPRIEIDGENARFVVE
jgi:8-oxo-dGTP pyrophosphatase MutT (NUDIX family)